MTTAKSTRSGSFRVLGAFLLGLSVPAGGAACSVINRFDDLRELTGGGGSGTSTVGSTAASSTSATTSASTGGSDADARGILVVGGRIVENGVQQSHRVFAVLDAATGATLSRYNDLSLVAAAHDRATDLWYLFEADTLPADKNKPIALHVGTIEASSGRWRELASISSKLPVIADALNIGVLNQRVVYAAFDPTFDAGGVPPIGLAVLDTTNARAGGASPAPIGVNGFVSLAADGGPLGFSGLIATPAAGPGGQVNLIKQNCAGSTTSCVLYRYFMSFGADPGAEPVPNADMGTAIPASANGVSAAWGSLFQNSAYDTVAYPPQKGDAGDGIAKIFRLTVAVDATGELVASFPVTTVASGEQFTGLAVAECEQIVLLAERNAQQLYAVPLPSSPSQVAPAQLSVNEVTSLLYFDPVTSNVVMPVQPAGSPFHLDAWHLGSDGSGITLAPLDANAFSPPSDLAIDVVAVRRPPGFKCR